MKMKNQIVINIIVIIIISLLSNESAYSLLSPMQFNTDTNTNLKSTDNSKITTNTPSAPSINLVITGDTEATVTFAAPSSDGGKAITGYTVTSNPLGGVD